MEILIVSSLTSDEMYDYIYNSRNKLHVDPAQKFFRNLAYGFLEDEEDRITCISIPPVSYSTHKKEVWERQEEVQDGIKFISIPFENGLIKRYVSQYRSAKKEVKKWLKETNGKTRVVLCDVLIAHVTYSVFGPCKKNRCKVYSVATDLPLQWMKMGKVRGGLFEKSLNYVYNFFAEYSLKIYDGYIWLTQQMNDLKNHRGKPYIVVEGFADVKRNSECSSDMALPERYIMYAGGINKVFHLEYFVEAFLSAKIKDTSLLFWGNGNDLETIKRYSEENDNIKYMGVVASDKLLKYEKKAILLVNPRPTNDDYTKFSFPSKTLEYMGSGTATLSTRLPGIPSDYEPYLFWFNNDDVEGMSATLKEILNKDDNELRDFGDKAAKYVHETKSAKNQAKRIKNMILNQK